MRPLGPGAEIAPGVQVLAHLHRSNRLDVYDATCARRATRVIAKALRPDRRSEPAARRALVREGTLLRRLAHPHLVRGYEVHEGPRPVIVMETLTGATLEHVIHDGPRRLPAGDLALLGHQLASALHYLHGERVLHLDLKPANLVVQDGRIVVIDLSHARAPGAASAGNGTWCYASPEQARGGELTPAADVWGLGAVLHEAATRRVALADLADELDTDTPQLEGPMPPVASLRRGLPPELSGLIDACLGREPTARPAVPEVLLRLGALGA